MTRFSDTNPLVFTIKDRCRVCYTCVRECPVKAIKIINGQAEVINSRCIACGNCIRVCSQNAKSFYKSINEVQNLINSENITIACIAPSFPAEFIEFNDFKKFVGLVKDLGFDYVTEVAFGADLVAAEYKKFFNTQNPKSCISSDCPAIVYYIKQYHPELIENLAPIISPAMAMAKVVKQKFGQNAKVVFIGPCIAKKAESNEVDEVLTFSELRKMLNLKKANIENIKPINFDEPFSGKGAIFPISRGLIRTSGSKEGFAEGEVIVAEGRKEFKEALKEFSNGLLKGRHLELLCCEGCIQGGGMTKKNNFLAKQMRVSNYVKEKLDTLDKEKLKLEIEKFSNIGFERSYKSIDRRISTPDRDQISAVLVSMGKKSETDMLNCGACGYETCNEHAIAIVSGLAETEMCLPYTIKRLHESVENLHYTNKTLSKTKKALMQSEKLASMGQLSAGIAHELNNPLGVITLYSNILKEEIDAKNPLYDDLSLIVEQTERCKNIVGGLLNFARKKQLKYSTCNIVNFLEHSFKSIIKPSEVKIQFTKSADIIYVDIDEAQLMQVVSNLQKNAIEAMSQSGILSIDIKEEKETVIISISDTGSGILPENIDKIFTPFFTTKGTGKGTGLGLPIVYGIIKMHKGKLTVTSNTNKNNGQTGTKFEIILPKRQ